MLIANNKIPLMELVIFYDFCSRKKYNCPVIIEQLAFLIANSAQEILEILGRDPSISRIERKDDGPFEGRFSRLYTRGVQLAASARMRAINGCLNRNNRAYAQWREPQQTRHLTERTTSRLRTRARHLWHCAKCARQRAWVALLIPRLIATTIFFISMIGYRRRVDRYR